MGAYRQGYQADRCLASTVVKEKNDPTFFCSDSDFHAASLMGGKVRKGKRGV